jgi:hypothetical protein
MAISCRSQEMEPGMQTAEVTPPRCTLAEMAFRASEVGVDHFIISNLILSRGRADG